MRTEFDAKLTSNLIRIRIYVQLNSASILSDNFDSFFCNFMNIPSALFAGAHSSTKPGCNLNAGEAIVVVVAMAVVVALVV